MRTEILDRAVDRAFLATRYPRGHPVKTRPYGKSRSPESYKHKQSNSRSVHRVLPTLARWRTPAPGERERLGATQGSGSVLQTGSVHFLSPDQKTDPRAPGTTATTMQDSLKF